MEKRDNNNNKKKTKKGGKGGQRSNDLLKHMAKELRRAHDKEINYTGASPPPPLRLELNTNKCNYFRQKYNNMSFCLTIEVFEDSV